MGQSKRKGHMATENFHTTNALQLWLTLINYSITIHLQACFSHMPTVTWQSPCQRNKMEGGGIRLLWKADYGGAGATNETKASGKYLATNSFRYINTLGVGGGECYIFSDIAE